jgi:3-phosphoshikimate 1-carboxyvinyltransferase
MASLLNDSPELHNLPEASDVTILIDCLKAIGLQVEAQENSLRFKNHFPACELPGPVKISVGEGGTTARFLAALLLLGKSEYQLILGKRLKERPWQEFLDLAASLGGKASLAGDTLTLQGPIKLPDELSIDCSKTTQFATAFQLLSVAVEVNVIPVNMNSSQSYWAMTEKMVKELSFAKEYSIPGDWSSASYPLAFGALNHEMEFPGLQFDRFQSDAKFYDLLKSFDCVESLPEGIKIHPLSKHRSVRMDVSDCLDLVPTLGYFLGHIDGNHELTGVENLVHKESDRLGEVIRLLKAFGREASTDGHTLFINGSHSRLSHEVNLNLPDDHRMVMTGSLFLIHHSGGNIAPREAVNKSYPGFFDLISF